MPVSLSYAQPDSAPSEPPAKGADFGDPPLRAAPEPPTTMRSLPLNPGVISMQATAVMKRRSSTKQEDLTPFTASPPPPPANSVGGRKRHLLVFDSGRADPASKQELKQFDADKDEQFRNFKVPGSPFKIPRVGGESEPQWLHSKFTPIAPNAGAAISIMVRGEFTFAIAEYDADQQWLGTHNQRDWYFDKPTQMSFRWVPSRATHYIVVSLMNTSSDDTLPLIIHPWLEQ